MNPSNLNKAEQKDTFKIGITGTIGSGKSMVGRILSGQNIPVLDVDNVVHVLLDRDMTVQSQIQQRFGKEYLIPNPDGGMRVDRGLLGKLVFQDEKDRRDLEKIVHPAVLSFTEQWIHDQHTPVAAVLIPLLFEAGKPRNFNQVWSVTCAESTLRRRLKERSNLSEEDINRRLAAQLSQDEKAALADSVIDNSGTIEETHAQILSLLSQIQQSVGLLPTEPRELVSRPATE